MNLRGPLLLGFWCWCPLQRYFFPLSEKAEKLFEKEMKMEIMDQIMETLWNDREFREFFMKKVREAEILA